MPSLTLQTLMSEATSAIGQRLDLSQSQVSLLANIAQEEVALMLPHTELMKTATLVLAAASSATVLPSDLREVVDVIRVNSFDAFGHRLLTAVPPREIDDAPDSTGTTTGVVNRYAITSSNSITFYPPTTSIDTFTLRYIAVQPDMTSLTSLPSLATRYHTAILYKLCENLADRVVDNQRAAYYRNKFLSVMGTVPTPSDVLNRSERTFP